ncbi:MAG TPA: hypothetical protein VF808_10530 [Ktedonobacterales bacterium]
MSASIERNELMTPRRQPSRRARAFAGALLIAGMALLTACGQSSGGTPAATETATVPLPTATATLAPTPTAPATATSGPTATTCQPDPYGIYSEQTSYVASLTDAPFAAPPKTKHGIGSSGNNGTVSEGGESGVCTIGSFTTITTFYDHLLTGQGWQFSAPPSTIAACFHGSTPAKAWWKGLDTFAWYDSGSAGGGSVFWSYTYCAAHG